ncbi:MAG TPA: PQQ-binding-like beta-propeller repeat protein [Candidatus Acidoferrales bacterium]|nr:PQQ-binding-like beta-propeller repeat protein [Candidatus Acidoferrales bacterium]
MRSVTSTLALVATILAAVRPVAATDWPVFGFAPVRNGFNASERVLSPANVAHLREKWQIALGTVADSTPIYIDRVIAGGVARAMLFQTDKAGVTYGIDARTGKIVWRYLTHGPNITDSTPAMDPSGTAIYVPGVDGMIHKLDAGTGHELRAPGFPARLTRMPQSEKDASSLNVAGGYLYATTSGYLGDAPPYDGHVLAVRLSDGSRHVFNSLCSADKRLPTPTSCAQQRSGIWGRGGAVADPDPAMKGAVFATTGNGDFDANQAGGDDYGDSTLGLSADVTQLLGHYTPRDYRNLDVNDIDMGSTSPALLPRQPNSDTPLMLLQGGKDETLRLVDRAHLPGVGGELQRLTIASMLFSTPAVWTDPAGAVWIYIGLPQEVEAYRLVTSGGKSRLAGVWRSTAGSTSGEGTSPAIAGGIVFVAMDDQILGLDARTGRLLWSSAQKGAGRSIGPVHWQSPIVVDGHVYCSDENGHLTAFGLP